MSTAKDIKVRKAKAWTALNGMEKIWKSDISRALKERFFTATVESVLLYGSKAWSMTSAMEKSLNGCYTRMLRAAFNISWRDHLTNEELYLSIPQVTEKVRSCRLQLAGHCFDHPELPAHDVLLLQPKHGNRGRGRPCCEFSRIDAARLADELRAEQEHASSQEKAKRSLEGSIAELDQRLAEANDIAAKGGRNAMAKLESRIRELEIELGSCQSKTSENYKAFQKAERRIKELQFQSDEDHKNQDRMSELANKLQQKIKTYKKQIEEAEEIAALNLAKFRKAQQELEEAEERSKMAGAQLSVVRGASIGL